MKERIISRSKLIAAAIAAVVLLCAAVSGVMAYLQAETPKLENTFTAGDTDITIPEKFENNYKTSIKVRNTEDSVVAYIRVTVLSYMTDSEGNPTADPIPEGYFDVATATGWYDSANWALGADGFYYCKKPVAIKGEVELLASGQKLKMADGENIVVLAEAIQAAGKDSGVPAVVKSWGSAVSGINSDGTLQFK